MFHVPTKNMGSFESKPENNMSEKEKIKLHKKEVRKAISGIEREINRMETQEKKLKSDILKAGKEQKTANLRILVKDLVRTQGTITKYSKIKGSLQGVQTTIQTAESMTSLKDGIKNAATAMKELNRRTNIPELNSILTSFAQGVGMADELQDQLGVRCLENPPSTRVAQRPSRAISLTSLFTTTPLPCVFHL